MTWHEYLMTHWGIDLSIVLGGAFGGSLRSLSRDRFTFREAILSPICGAMAAAYLTTPVIHYMRMVNFPLPTDEQPTILASAFLIGTCAMWLSDFLFKVAGKWWRVG